MAANPSRDVVYRGTCMCGDINYTLHGDPNGVLACYCSHCRLNAGTTHQITAEYDTSKVSLDDPKGVLKVYIITEGTTSGLPKHKSFCGTCGCTLWTSPKKHDFQIRYVRTSLVEKGLELEQFKPTYEIFKPKEA